MVTGSSFSTTVSNLVAVDSVFVFVVSNFVSMEITLLVSSVRFTGSSSTCKADSIAATDVLISVAVVAKASTESLTASVLSTEDPIDVLTS